MMTESYVNIADQVSSRSEISLPVRVETLLEKIYGKHNGSPVTIDTRRRLSLISEESALETLSKVFNTTYVKSTLDAIIICFLKDVTVNGSPRRVSGASPLQSPRTPGEKCSRVFQEMSLDSEARLPKLLRIEGNNRVSLHSPQLLALGELEFKKAFLLLSYIPGKSLAEIKLTADEIRGWKDLPMATYESTVWLRFGQVFCPQTERKMLEWDSGKTHYYQCHVAPDGTYRFKGPILENTGTLLHRAVGDENVLTVKFADGPGEETYSNESYSVYKEIAKKGIMLGLRRYHFFVFKDGGKEEKKKDFSTKGVKCYFIRTDSTTSNDMGKTYIFSGKSIHEARMHFMHVNTLPTLAKYMIRFSLILSKTKPLEADLTRVNVKKIPDIHCHDQDNNEVLDKNGEPCIHSNGTGFISEDLARLCPTDIFKGKSYNTQGTSGQDPPLLIQFRMFKDGDAYKGTLLLNKNLPPGTIQVRPSMIKVEKDPTLSNFRTFNSLEVVSTSNPPRETKLSRNLVALLSNGGVPNDFFLGILEDTLKKSKTIFQNENAAMNAALNYGGMDDHNTLEMITAGIPLLNTEKNGLRAGKLPITDSYYLMGTVDPTGKLKENEVCVILKDGHLSGDVVVYRNPGLHPGDIHVLKATHVKALENYVGKSKYGVFFPQKGPRSLGDEIAGGDFDGDLYFISRNPELLKHFKPSEPWVSSSPPTKVYPSTKPSELPPEELEELLFKMFLKARFDSSNVVGAAADSWLTIMDPYLTLRDEIPKEKDEKARREKKLQRAIDIYYDALDAPKKGAKVSLPLDLKPNIFPHYMEGKKNFKKFKSTSILGIMYDTVENAEEELPPPEISKLPCFEAEGISEPIMERCRMWYDNYKKEMSQALDKNEKEAANEVIQRYKQEFYGAERVEDSPRSLKELYQQALGLYNITYDYAIEMMHARYCGFVWKVAGPVLCQLYNIKNGEKSVLFSTSMLKRRRG